MWGLVRTKPCPHKVRQKVPYLTGRVIVLVCLAAAPLIRRAAQIALYRALQLLFSRWPCPLNMYYLGTYINHLI